MAVISDRKQQPSYSAPAPGEEDPLLPPRGPPPAYDGPSSSSAAGPSSRIQQQPRRAAPLRTRKSIFSLFSTRDHHLTSEEDEQHHEEDEEEQDEEQEIDPTTYQGRHIIRTRRQADLAQRRHTRRVRRAVGCCRRCCVLFCWVILGAGVIAGLGALVLFILQEKSDDGGERVIAQSARLLAQG
ncbi:hypothetical protein A4X13_0g59 [Tilletia indica]|uniref:Uncharacterized protein n=1 Tax=Tilletia indica TaxID=43049 RepID=A0A177TJH8_9BASI|nr:hypothetical protein A4X13_0g59 [Tilletia indica]